MWCYFCGFPTTLHGNRAPTGKGTDCPAGDFSLGVAWAVYVETATHKEMQVSLGCHPGVWTDANAWFSWLAKVNQEECVYNLHRVTRWFLEKTGHKFG